VTTLEQVLSATHAAGVRLWVEDGGLRFRGPTGAMSEELRAQVRQYKLELVALLGGGANGRIPRMPEAADYPLSPAQRRLWVLAQLEEGRAVYSMPFALELAGELDRVALERALDDVVDRHESLRTIFVEVRGEPRQRVQPAAGAAPGWRDLTGEADPDLAACALATAEARRPFDLECGPLFRAQLVRLAPTRHLLLTTMHHIVADGLSLGVFVRELAQAYRTRRAGAAPDWIPLPLQYRDYAVWQLARSAAPEMAAHSGYWREKLVGAPPALELPTDRPRPAVQTFRGRIHAFRLDDPRRRGLVALARREQASLFMVLVALVKVLLRRHTGQEDIVVASPIAGREHADLTGQIGFYLNTLVLRDRVPGGASFLEVLRGVRQTALKAYEHQAFPFDQLVEELDLPRDLSRSPLCDVVVVLQNTGDLRLLLPEVEARAFPFETGISKFDLTFDFQEAPDGLHVGLEFNTDLFDSDRMARLAAQFSTLVDRVLADATGPVGRLEILPEEERRRVLEEFNTTEVTVPAGVDVVTMIEAQVEQSPGAPAVEFDGRTLTYDELNTRANRLAHHLRAEGAGQGALVAVCLERSTELVVALLAVLKTGATYVPLDPAFPTERLAYMLEDSGASLLIGEFPVGGGSAGSCRRIDMGAVEGADAPAGSPARRVDGDTAAYVIYTSGSTGRPKGVEVLHRGLTNFLLGMQREPGLTAADTLLAVTTVSFDIAGLEMWLPLTVGARVVLVSRETAADGTALRETLHRSRANFMQATPATWRLLLAAGWRGTPGLRILCGGEALPGELAGLLLVRGAEVWNVYGPTETTVWSTAHRVSPADASLATVTIGRPIANTRCYVVDAAGEPAPIGVPGELWIGGEGVARGYWRRPELTAEKFVRDPFARSTGARVYRTGDIARWRADGTLEFLGRGDHQVKLRGFRIELGEIEAALLAHALVRAAAVALREVRPGDPQLVAYVVPRDAPVAMAELRDHLRAKLPDYMVPGAWVSLAELPLTSNGKVDRRALPVPGVEARPAAAKHVPPRTPAEAAVAAAWAEVLGAPQVGAEDNFFDLGGHSLKATMAVARLRERHGGAFTLADLFRHPTVAAFARLLPDTPPPVEAVAPLTAEELELLND